MAETTKDVHAKYEPHPDVQILTGHSEDLPKGVAKDVDYEPHPEKSLKVSAEHEQIVQAILRLYGGSCSEQDMQVYDEKAIYDDPYSYCDTRYKVAGQWYGLPTIFSELKTLKTEIVSDKPDEIIFKLRHQYTLKVLKATKVVDSLVSLSLDDHGKVKYHKDMWNEKDYSHEGFGKTLKKLNGDKLTTITKPEKTL